MRLPPLVCLDCGKPYIEFALDSMLSDKQRLLIHDREGGLLCANCIVSRASKLPGAVVVRMQIEFERTPRHWLWRGCLRRCMERL